MRFSLLLRQFVFYFPILFCLFASHWICSRLQIQNTLVLHRKKWTYQSSIAHNLILSSWIFQCCIVYVYDNTCNSLGGNYQILLNKNNFHFCFRPLFTTMLCTRSLSYPEMLVIVELLVTSMAWERENMISLALKQKNR